MKKLAIMGLFVALAFAVNAWAGFGLPSTGSSLGDKAVNMAKNKGVEKVINDKLAKMKCTFKSDNAMTVSEVTGCDISKIGNELAMWKQGLEQTIVNKVKVNVTANHKKDNGKAWDRARNLCNELSKKVSWWDCIESTGTGSNTALFSVSVN